MNKTFWLLGAWALARALRRSRWDLDGKVVIVTGGARGLGLVLARELVRRGAKVVLAARDSTTLSRAHRELARGGAEVLAVRCDVRDRGSVEQLVAAARSTFGRVDALINDAGVMEVGPLETMTYDDFERSMGTHFFGPLNTMSAVIDEMKARREGRILNIASIGGLVPVPHLAPYSASKAALVGLSGAFAAELRPFGIQVTTACPGLMRTGSPSNATFKGRASWEHRWFGWLDAIPLLSTRAERAARKLVDAMERGTPFVMVGRHFRLVQAFSALFPNLFARLLGLTARLLPGPSSTPRSARGYEIGARISPRTARQNNELDWAPH